jgi:hypothetical protein
MKKILPGMASLTVALFSSALMAAPGEWWEVTAKMEMEGMPFAMPGQTSKMCMPKGGESDPNNTQGKDRNCRMTDVKHSGNTVKFKGSCVNQGETMNMEGESSHDSNSFKSNVKMTGKSRGQNMNMSMVSNGKRIGGACDTEEVVKKAKVQMDANLAQMNADRAKMCDTSAYKAANWVSSASLFIGAKPACPGKKNALCRVMKNDVPRDLQAFQTLEQNEGIKGMPSAVAACNMNLGSMRKTLCKTRAKTGPLSFLEASCPAEAKAYRELQRKRADCEGRGFTGADYRSLMKKCMGGELIEAEASAAEGSPASSSKSAADAEPADSSISKNTSEAVREGGKVLKGLFGF